MSCVLTPNAAEPRSASSDEAVGLQKNPKNPLQPKQQRKGWKQNTHTEFGSSTNHLHGEWDQTPSGRGASKLPEFGVTNSVCS